MFHGRWGAPGGCTQGPSPTMRSMPAPFLPVAAPGASEPPLHRPSRFRFPRPRLEVLGPGASAEAARPRGRSPDSRSPRAVGEPGPGARRLAGYLQPAQDAEPAAQAPLGSQSVRPRTLLPPTQRWRFYLHSPPPPPSSRKAGPPQTPVPALSPQFSFSREDEPWRPSRKRPPGRRGWLGVWRGLRHRAPQVPGIRFHAFHQYSQGMI
ncbi:proline-rich protein HaeIII subfamily 1-like [Erinaceus europaeus]|uniref:Proline-rich protein HaeIII subfamily 1-like n=1 Tax=Erinaceus europaeus TaxID=9365 RepID=A0ABM3Y1K0_ERIEU|nr:proline-rich protein HaeIII subfamily 1-like [Erinaceus europaeus]